MAPAPPPARRRVLVAEDEALIRLDLVEMLGEEGYDVVGEAGDGRSAVALAQELRPDVVILDVVSTCVHVGHLVDAEWQWAFPAALLAFSARPEQP